GTKQVASKQGASKQTQAKTTQVKQIPGRQVTIKQVQAKAVPSKAAATRGKQYATAKRAPSPRYYAPVQPSAERYKDIQAALSGRGYFSGPVDGVWGASSTDALKRFQHDQNLAEEGKLDSLS